MKKLFSKKGLYVSIAAVAVALVAAITIFSMGKGSDPASNAVNTVMTPLKRVMSSIVDELEHIYAYMYRYDNIVEENRELRAQIAEMETVGRENAEVAAENERLRQLLEFSERHSDYKYLPGSVISWSASSWSSSFTVSKGSAAGVELGDCVINENGYLIGRITEVSAASATVTTLLDTTTSIGVTVSSTNATGILAGDFSLMNAGQAKLMYLASDDSAVPGDTIVTSGKGGVYPKGLVIGTVLEMVISKSGTEDYAVIEPSIDFSSLSDVYIITEFSIYE